MLSQLTAIVLLVKLKLSHKSGETADALTALLMSSAKKAFASRCCLDIPGVEFFTSAKYCGNNTSGANLSAISDIQEIATGIFV